MQAPYIHLTQSTHVRLIVPITSVMAVTTIISSSWTDTRVGSINVCQLTGASPSLVKKLLDFFVTCGIPEYLASDGGPEFTAAFTHQFLRDSGGAHRLSSVAYSHYNTHAEIRVKSATHLITYRTPGHRSTSTSWHSSEPCSRRGTHLRHHLQPLLG